MGLNIKKLNFGCGSDIRKGWDNIDIDGGDFIFDFNKFPYPIPNNTYDYVYACDVLEHLDKPKKVLDELNRICKPGAIVEIFVPYYNTHYAFNDMEHMHYFNDITFYWYVKNEYNFNHKQIYRIVELNLVPTVVGKLIPSKILRKKLSYFIGHILQGIHVKLEVVK